MRRGRRLGVDVGEVRIGVAVCDPEGLVATPVETVPADDLAVTRIAALVVEHQVIELVVGLPLSLSGRESHAAAKARAFAQQLAAASRPVPVRMVDERMSTVTAAAHLRQSGRRRTRPVIDQAAATVILQSALEAERSSGRPPGETLEGITP